MFDSHDVYIAIIYLIFSYFVIFLATLTLFDSIPTFLSSSFPLRCSLASTTSKHYGLRRVRSQAPLLPVAPVLGHCAYSLPNSLLTPG